MSRAELLVPEGWRPRIGSVVTVLASKDMPAPPPGRWKVYSQAPGSSRWWAMPTSDDAREWARRHPTSMTMGSMDLPGRHLIPAGHRPPRASDLQDPGSVRR